MDGRHRVFLFVLGKLGASRPDTRPLELQAVQESMYVLYYILLSSAARQYHLFLLVVSQWSLGSPFESRVDGECCIFRYLLFW